MTPQELMDLPHYGMAEKQLKKQGDWELTGKEKIKKMIDKLGSCVDDVVDAANDCEYALSNVETAMEATQ